MATPTSLPAAVATGDTGTAAQFNGLRGAFRILQVVSSRTTAQVGSTSATYGDIGLSATITPQSTSSKILVLLAQNCYSDGAGTGVGIQILRGATILTTSVALSFGQSSGIVTQNFLPYYDSPSSTSALTYKVQMSRTSGAGIAYTQINANPSDLILLEVSA